MWFQLEVCSEMVIFVGVPYLYLTSMELSVKDLAKDSRASLTMSLKQEGGISFSILQYGYCIFEFVRWTHLP